MTKEYGKIKSIEFGYCGYQDSMLGYVVQLGKDNGWGVRSDNASNYIDADVITDLSKLLIDGNVQYVSQLKGKPVEAVFNEENKLVSWRIFKEVL